MLTAQTYAPCRDTKNPPSKLNSGRVVKEESAWVRPDKAAHHWTTVAALPSCVLRRVRIPGLALLKLPRVSGTIPALLKMQISQI
jgi:hypothetical protein